MVCVVVMVVTVPLRLPVRRDMREGFVRVVIERVILVVT